jgi:hypothetical protein
MQTTERSTQADAMQYENFVKFLIPDLVQKMGARNLYTFLLDRAVDDFYNLENDSDNGHSFFTEQKEQCEVYARVLDLLITETDYSELFTNNAYFKFMFQQWRNGIFIESTTFHLREEEDEDD